MKIVLALLLLVSTVKADWSTFSTPVSFTQSGNNVTLSISGSQVNQGSNYQGVGEMINSGVPWIVSGTLNVTTDYLTLDRAAFISAVPFVEITSLSDGSDNPQFPTLGIRNGRWEGWDGNGFIDLGPGSVGLHTFSISVGSQYNYAVDGVTLASYGQTVAPLIGVQLVSFNYGSDYVSQWSGVTPEPSLVGLALLLLVRRKRGRISCRKSERSDRCILGLE